MIGDTGTVERLPQRIETPRLLLRRWRHDEAALLREAVIENLEHLRPWMPWIATEPLTVRERVVLIEQWTREWEAGQGSSLGVFLDGVVIGGAGFHCRVGPRAVEIGYWIDRDHLRRGYATELVEAMTTEALALERFDRVHVHTDEANVASSGIPAKLGFGTLRVDEREPEAPAESGRLIIWTVDRAAWDRRHPEGHSQGSPNVSR